MLSFFDFLLGIFSNEASNFGSFIAGIGTLGLMILAIFSYRRWYSERCADKLSSVAEEALNHLDIFKDRIEDWIKFADTWIIYNRQSNDNVQKFDQLSSEERKKLSDIFANDRYEVHNYCKEAYEIMRELRSVKYKAARLSNQKLNKKIIEFEKTIKQLPDSLFSKHFPVADSTMIINAEEAFRNASEKIEIFYTTIHRTLIDVITFQK